MKRVHINKDKIEYNKIQYNKNYPIKKIKDKN